MRAEVPAAGLLSVRLQWPSRSWRRQPPACTARL